MRNSLYNDGILDSTDNCETFDNMGQKIKLQRMVAFRGYLSPNNGEVTLPSGLNLQYIYWLYLRPNVVSWIGGNQDGITFLLLQNSEIVMTDAVKNAKFLFFDVVSTYEVGKIRLYGRSLVVCEGDINTYLSKKRSDITWNLLNQSEWKGMLLYLIPPNFFDIKSINSGKPYGLTIAINNNKQIVYPPCDASMVSCYSSGGNPWQGYCFNPSDNNSYSTYTIPRYDNVFNPSKVINGVNYWFRRGGRNYNLCRDAPNSKSENKVKDVNKAVGVGGVINLDENVDKMSQNAFNLRNKIVNLQAKIDRREIDLDKSEAELMKSRSMIKENEDVIKEKMKLLDSRNRQLQLSIDKNIYNKKIIYVLLAVAIAVLIIILFGVSFVKNMNKN